MVEWVLSCDYSQYSWWRLVCNGPGCRVEGSFPLLYQRNPTPFLRCPTDNTVDVNNGKTVDDCEHPWDEATTVVIVVEPVCLVTTDDQRRIHPHCHPFNQSPIHLKPSVSGPSPFVAWEVHPNLLVLFWFLSRVVPNDWLWFLWKIDEEISWTDSALPLVSYPSRVVVLVNWAGATTRPPRWR